MELWTEINPAVLTVKTFSPDCACASVNGFRKIYKHQTNCSHVFVLIEGTFILSKKSVKRPKSFFKLSLLFLDSLVLEER